VGARRDGAPAAGEREPVAEETGDGVTSQRR
jgi:hypothetical protein